MNIKDYLSRYYYISQEIELKLESIAKLDDMVKKCTSSVSPTPRNPSPLPFDSLIVKCMEDKEKILRDIEELVDEQRQIRETINSISDPVARCIFENRYMLLKSWKDIADRYNRSVRWVLVKHDAGLRDIEKINV